jgi:phage host-nuclease inhibitor protein Gam
MSNKTIEQKKKDYRDYLENSGVLEQITKALVSLYEEIDRPVNPIEYIRRNLVDPDEEINDKKKKEYLDYQRENVKLQEEIKDLKKKIKELSNDSDDD